MITAKHLANNKPKCFLTHTPKETTNRKVMKITFDSSSHTFYVSLKILVDNFDLCKKINNLKIIDENENCMNICFVGSDNFGTFLEIVDNGEIKTICNLY